MGLVWDVGKNRTDLPRTSCNFLVAVRVVDPHPHQGELGEADDIQHFGTRNS